ncbi:MAG TPA: YqaJ viral recombinase family protein [Xanthobacteraceae bacterium]
MRKRDVTASTIGALYGVHPYLTALKLYMQHSGVEFSDADNPVLRRGRLMEPAAALAVGEQRPDWLLEKSQFYFRDPDCRLGATPDYFIHGDERGLGVLQLKTAAPSVFEREWQDGKTPLWIELQVTTEAALTGAAFAVVAALKVDAYDLSCVIREVELLPVVQQRIRDAVKQFWNDVEAGREPDPDYGKDAELLALIAPHEVPGKSIDLGGDNELLGLLDQREAIMAQLSRFDDRKQEIETQIKYLMRDADRIVGLPGWSITWKSYHRDQYTVPAKDIRTLRIHHKDQANG